MIDFSPLWKIMSRKGVTQYALLKHGVIDNKTLNRLKNNGNVTLLTLEKLCAFLNCTLDDIVRFGPPK